MFCSLIACKKENLFTKIVSTSHRVNSGTKRQESSKYNYYIMSPRVILKRSSWSCRNQSRLLGCNNGIHCRGVPWKPYTFSGFNIARVLISLKNAPQNNAVLRYNKTWRQNANGRKSPTILTVTEPKYVPIPIFLHIPRAHKQGQICIYGVVGKILMICLDKKFLCF